MKNQGFLLIFNLLNDFHDRLSYMDFPYERWSQLRTNNGLERIMKEIRRRARVVGNFEILVSISRFLKLSRIYC